MSVDTQRAAVITGGTRGIGKQIAHRMTADGYAMVLGYAGNEVAAKTTVCELTEYGEKPLAMRPVVAEEADVVALFGGRRDPRRDRRWTRSTCSSRSRPRCGFGCVLANLTGPGSSTWPRTTRPRPPYPTPPGNP